MRADKILNVHVVSRRRCVRTKMAVNIDFSVDFDFVPKRLCRAHVFSHFLRAMCVAFIGAAKMLNSLSVLFACRVNECHDTHATQRCMSAIWATTHVKMNSKIRSATTAHCEAFGLQEIHLDLVNSTYLFYRFSIKSCLWRCAIFSVISMARV